MQSNSYLECIDSPLIGYTDKILLDEGVCADEMRLLSRELESVLTFEAPWLGDFPRGVAVTIFPRGVAVTKFPRGSASGLQQGIASPAPHQWMFFSVEDDLQYYL